MEKLASWKKLVIITQIKVNKVLNFAIPQYVDPAQFLLSVNVYVAESKHNLSIQTIVLDLVLGSV